jgi:hypothetical protein
MSMNAPLYVVPPTLHPPPEPAVPVREIVDLLRQLITLQQEQLNLVKSQLANQDGTNRWRSFLARWDTEFPNLGAACKQTVPALERAYLSLIRELTERVMAADAAELDDEFVLGEFLDRYGIRLGQLGNILGQLTPLAEAAPPDSGPTG